MTLPDPEQLPPSRDLPKIPVRRVRVPRGHDPDAPPPAPREHIHPAHPPLPEGPPVKPEGPLGEEDPP